MSTLDAEEVRSKSLFDFRMRFLNFIFEIDSNKSKFFLIFPHIKIIMLSIS